MLRIAMLAGAACLAAAVAACGESNGVTAGDGGHGTEVSECQDRVWGDQMHLAELEFTPNSVWHQTKPDLKVGGKLTMPGNRGMKTPFNYECTFRGGRLIAAQVQ